MKRSKFSDSQTIEAVKRVESVIGVPDICRELGVSVMTHKKKPAKVILLEKLTMSMTMEEDIKRWTAKRKAA